MSTTVSFLPHRTGWLSRLRRRDLFVGMGYSTAIVLLLMVGWDVDGLLPDILSRGAEAALLGRARFFVLEMGHQLPTVPLLTVAINLAPAHGIRRYATLAMVAFAMWGVLHPVFLLRGGGR